MEEIIKNAEWGDKFLTEGGKRLLYIGLVDDYPCFIPEGEIMPDMWKRDGHYPANEEYNIVRKI